MVCVTDQEVRVRYHSSQDWAPPVSPGMWFANSTASDAADGSFPDLLSAAVRCVPIAL